MQSCARWRMRLSMTPAASARGQANGWRCRTVVQELSQGLYPFFAQNHYAGLTLRSGVCMMKLVGTKYRLVVLTLAPFVIAGTAPASATIHSRTTQSSRQLYMYAPDELWPKPLSKPEQTSAQRMAAVRECNARAGKIGAARDWQTATFAIYGACMLEHRQEFG